MTNSQEERHHTDAEYDELKAQLKAEHFSMSELSRENQTLRDELAQLKKDAPPLIYDSNAKMWILAGAVLLRNQAGDLLGLVRASDYYEKDREKK